MCLVIGGVCVMQLVLSEFGVDVYSELKRLGYVENKKADILFLLWDLKNHSSSELVFVGGLQYNARIFELRREGFSIVSERLNDGSFTYRLENHKMVV